MKPWIAMGDSLTRGVGLSKQDQWVSIVSNKLNIDILNYGLPGATSDYGKEVLASIITLNPELVLINFGVNDAIIDETGSSRNELSTYEGNLRYFIEELRKIDCDVIFTTPHRILYGENIGFYSRHDKGKYDLEPNEILKRYRDVMIKVCKLYKVPYIDLYDEPRMSNLEDVLISLENSDENDGVHYSTQGSKVVADCVLKAIEKRRIK